MSQGLPSIAKRLEKSLYLLCLHWKRSNHLDKVELSEFLEIQQLDKCINQVSLHIAVTISILQRALVAWTIWLGIMEAQPAVAA